MITADLTGRTALVTGGASGIGLATVRRLVACGASVAINDLAGNPKLAEAGAQLRREGLDVIAVPGSVGSPDDANAVVEASVRRFGRLDCVFNNAGYEGVGGKIEDVSADGFDATISVLLRGVFLGMKHAAPVMKKQGAGSIISTASVAGLRTGLGPHIYSAAKAAVIHLTHSVAMELGEHGVRVNCICPGAIATPIFGKSMGLTPEKADEIIPMMKGVLENFQPIKRPGVPDDIARAALWLASDESTFVNGHALVVDGGVIGGRPWSESQLRREKLRAALGLS